MYSWHLLVDCLDAPLPLERYVFFRYHYQFLPFLNFFLIWIRDNLYFQFTRNISKGRRFMNRFTSVHFTWNCIRINRNDWTRQGYTSSIRSLPSIRKTFVISNWNAECFCNSTEILNSFTALITIKILSISLKSVSLYSL